VPGDNTSKTREAIADKKITVLNNFRYSSPLKMLAIPITPSTKKKYVNECRNEVCGSVDQSTERKRKITIASRSIEPRLILLDLL
jgi:hypothetical protein